jgi:hypothetical protein
MTMNPFASFALRASGLTPSAKQRSKEANTLSPLGVFCADLFANAHEKPGLSSTGNDRSRQPNRGMEALVSLSRRL